MLSSILSECFFYACLQGSTGIVSLILENKYVFIDVNHRSFNGEGDVCMHGAIYSNSQSLLSYLLSVNADVHLKNNHHYSAYEDSIRKRKTDLTQVIEQHLRINGQKDKLLDHSKYNDYNFRPKTHHHDDL